VTGAPGPQGPTGSTGAVPAGLSYLYSVNNNGGLVIGVNSGADVPFFSGGAVTGGNSGTITSGGAITGPAANVFTFTVPGTYFVNFNSNIAAEIGLVPQTAGMQLLLNGTLIEGPNTSLDLTGAVLGIGSSLNLQAAVVAVAGDTLEVRNSGTVTLTFGPGVNIFMARID